MTSAESPWLVPLSDLIVDEELGAAVRETVSSGWWSMGARVAEFEREFAGFVGSKHALAVTNGTAALHLGLLGLGCGLGDEVIVPSLNFVAAANTVVHVGAAPVFCDIIGDDDLTLDPADVEKAIGPATKAIAVMHYGGFPCRMDAVRELADRYEIAIIEDAAHAPGTIWRGRRCGTLGDVGCFSFFSNKNLPVGEGGMVVTDDDELAERLGLLRSHGMTTLTWDRHRGHSRSYDVLTAGFNYRLDEMRAAIGLVQLRRVLDENEHRRRIAQRYLEAFRGEDGLTMPFADHEARGESSHHLAVVLLDEHVSRDAVVSELARARIQTSVHYPPIHRFSFYAASSPRDLPRTDAVADRIVTLPLFGAMSDEQVDAVIEGVLAATRRAARA
jgi:dTDP-4-amino-4,6-dideoxygalactose transaminase